MILNLDKGEKLLLIKALENLPDKKAEKLKAKIERSLKQIKPRSAKNKGLGWEKECCELISNLTGIEYNQSDDSSLIQARTMGLNGTDVILRGEARERFPFDIECKSCNSLSVPAWVKQAEDNCTELDNWLLLIKSPVLSCKKIAVLSLSKFMEIVGEKK